MTSVTRGQPRTRHRGTTLVVCIGTLAALAAGCGSSGASKGTTSTTPAPKASRTSTGTKSTPSTPSVSSTTHTTGTDLSGRWSGRYSGAYSGTFTLSWQQKGSSLSGRITLSTPPNTERLTGTLKGAKITFGTVGSAAITYSGTVSGNSMSGAYRAGGAGGSWSATKSS
jgi:hypothetical protein